MTNDNLSEAIESTPETVQEATPEIAHEEASAAEPAAEAAVIAAADEEAGAETIPAPVGEAAPEPVEAAEIAAAPEVVPAAVVEPEPLAAPAPVAAAAPVVVPEPEEPAVDFGALLKDFERTHSHKTEPGARQLKGTVVSVSADQVFLDIGYKTEGVLARSAFPANGEGVKAGDVVHVSVTGRNEEGYYELSRFKVAQARDWTGLERAFAEKLAVVGTVTEVIKGGVSVDVGVRAFMPASRSGTQATQPSWRSWWARRLPAASPSWMWPTRMWWWTGAWCWKSRRARLTQGARCAAGVHQGRRCAAGDGADDHAVRRVY